MVYGAAGVMSAMDVSPPGPSADRQGRSDVASRGIVPFMYVTVVRALMWASWLRPAAAAAASPGIAQVGALRWPCLPRMCPYVIVLLLSGCPTAFQCQQQQC